MTVPKFFCNKCGQKYTGWALLKEENQKCCGIQMIRRNDFGETEYCPQTCKGCYK